MRAELAFAEALTKGDYGVVIALYCDEARAKMASGDIDAGCFYLTHAYVYALEADAAEVEDIRAELVKYGREE